MSTIIGRPSLSRQKIDIGDMIDCLEQRKQELIHKISVLRNGFDAVDKGEDMFEEKSILSQKVIKIMANKG